MKYKKRGTYYKIYKYQNCSCFYCNEYKNMEHMEKEHVFPVSKGGRGIKNKVLSCSFCNKLKSDLMISDFKNKIEKLLKETTDNELILKYQKINKKLNYLLITNNIRIGWHKKAKYKSENINKKPVCSY